MKPVLQFLAFGVLIAGGIYAAICGLLYVSQRSYIYYPVARTVDVPSFVLQRDDARIVVSFNDVASSDAVLYFGGNAEDVSGTIGSLSRAFPGAAVYAMHYRSYGGSGGSPSERALIDDAGALYDLIAKTHPKILVIGRSLGSGIAVQIAASKRIDRLVLVTPYDSLAELARRQFRLFPVRLLLRDKYESWRYASRVSVPTTIVVAGNDWIIPNDSSKRLAAAFPPGIVAFVRIPAADHNNVSDFPRYLQALSGESAPTDSSALE
ncbi:MAG TPA: hypothetical protein PKE27_15580 [Povalibacter sp.]|uniref:alpha/beta hydrolase n=1 Tax=Povalibacter sp. TaxID=1962978 RepID=UPI002CE44E2A|nr:hypothetical protein [Povalibacter sp.]HMN45998.1 hypothetical protein [Povalibacter sp.]